MRLSIEEKKIFKEELLWIIIRSITIVLISVSIGGITAATENYIWMILFLFTGLVTINSPMRWVIYLDTIIIGGYFQVVKHETIWKKMGGITITEAVILFSLVLLGMIFLQAYEMLHQFKKLREKKL